MDNPFYQEMMAVLFSQGMKYELENKMYSREKSKEAAYMGRLRIQLKNDDGTPVNPDYPTSELLNNSELPTGVTCITIIFYFQENQLC